MTSVLEREREVRIVEHRMAESIVADPPAVATPEGALDPRVLAGAALLDVEAPGWADRINLRLFNLHSAQACVCGQVFADEAADHGSGWDYAWSVYHDEDAEDAFGLSYGFLGAEDDEDDWTLLSADWRALIAERQART